MILKRQNIPENNWNHFKIVPKGHNHCQLSIVNCQFGEAAKFQFHNQLMKADSLIRNYFKIVPKGHNNCQLSIVNCQFGGAAKFQFIEP